MNNEQELESKSGCKDCELLGVQLIRGVELLNESEKIKDSMALYIKETIETMITVKTLLEKSDDS